MTAEIINFAYHLPRELRAAEERAHAACALAEARSQWSENRDAQSRANVGVYAPLSFNTWRIRYGVGIAALLGLYGAFEWAVGL